MRLASPHALCSNAVYWIGPTGGALLAGWIYTAWIMPPADDPETHHGGGHAANVHAAAGRFPRAKK